MRAFAVLLILVVLTASSSVPQVNLSPYINSGTAISLDSLTALGSSKIISVVGAKYLSIQLTTVVPKDSLYFGLDASQDSSKGWVRNIGSTGALVHETSSGTRLLYTDKADMFRYFRLWFAARDTTAAKIRLITVKASK